MIKIPDELEKTKAAALKAIGKVRPADNNTNADKKFLFNAQKTEASSRLPPYYLVYFLLIDLLGFKNLGQFEKISWSVPIDYDGQAFLIEHRKFGLGIFAHNASEQEKDAQEIAKFISKGVKAAKPFYEWLAAQAVQNSKLNVVNQGHELFERFRYFLNQYEQISKEAVDRKSECIVTKPRENCTIYHYPSVELRRNAQWLAQATIDAFFSWTEHVFIHIAILFGQITNATEVANLASDEWSSKFKKALDISDPINKKFFDQLLAIRKQLRNFMAHGAFGKEGEAFTFHSGAGAVPVLLDRYKNKNSFSIFGEIAFEEADAISTIQQFIEHLWSGERKPAYFYIQEGGLPLILPMALDGTYNQAMKSKEEMEQFVDHLCGQFDRAANMDW